MRLVPHSGGRSHLASYSERSVLRFGLPEILLSYIDCTYKVSVSLKTTPADVLSAVRFMPAFAGRARLRRVGFPDALHGHSAKSRLVLNHVGELPVGPLVEPLVRLASIVQTVPDSSQVAHYNCSDPSLVEGLYQPRGLLMKEILDLVSDLRQLPVLGTD